MADISKVKINNVSYNIKDATAREAISNINSFDYLICTNAGNTPQDVTWKSGTTTITGTLVASASTRSKIYLVPSTNGTKDVYDEYITINTTGSTYIWELFGNTDVHMGDLGALAFASSASGEYTPEGEVSQPTFEGTSGTVNVNGTIDDHVTISTGAGTTNYTPSGTISVTPTVTVNTTTVNSITNVGTLPTFNPKVEDEELSFEFTQGTLPTKGSNTTVATGIKSATATGSFTGTGVHLDGALDDTTVASTGTFTPQGNVTKPTFAGTKGTITVS